MSGSPLGQLTVTRGPTATKRFERLASKVRGMGGTDMNPMTRQKKAKVQAINLHRLHQRAFPSMICIV